MPEYPAFPAAILLRLAWAVVTGRRRSFRRDALACTRRLHLVLEGAEHIPQGGPGVLLVNHYFRPGFFAGWIPLAVSACVPSELTWVMTAAWTESDTIWSRLKAIISVPLFPRLAHIYGFIPMPPMPPRPHEVAARAHAVRQVLAAAREEPPLLLAIAPEGMDPPSGRGLLQPPPGVGRMLVKLGNAGCCFYPVGIYENGAVLEIHFGKELTLQPLTRLSSDEIDRRAANEVMQAIAALLPPDLRGVFG